MQKISFPQFHKSSSSKTNVFVSLGAVVFLIVLLVIFSFLGKGTKNSRAEEIETSLLEAGAYLVRSVNSNGKYIYEYNPVKDVAENRYNILRHAGTTYSLLELYRATDTDEYLRVAERTFQYLLGKIEECPFIPQTRCVVERDAVKLGGNALAIISFVEYQKATERADYLPLAQQLALWMVANQLSTGEFSIHKQYYSTGIVEDFVSEYYPGEAILALTRLHDVDGDMRWLQAANRGAQWLISVRDRNVPTLELLHDHWLLYALNELDLKNPSELYRTHAYNIVEAILAAQRTVDPEHPTWIGGFYNPPRSTPTATRAEGLIAAYEMAGRYGDTEIQGRILGALSLATQFQLRTQITEEESTIFSDPEQARGGFTESLENFVIRIDYVQHNISSLLGYRNILKDQEYSARGKFPRSIRGVYSKIHSVVSGGSQ